MYGFCGNRSGGQEKISWGFKARILTARSWVFRAVKIVYPLQTSRPGRRSITVFPDFIVFTMGTRPGRDEQDDATPSLLRLLLENPSEDQRRTGLSRVP